MGEQQQLILTPLGNPPVLYACIALNTLVLRNVIPILVGRPDEFDSGHFGGAFVSIKINERGRQKYRIQINSCLEKNICGDEHYYQCKTTYCGNTIEKTIQ